MDDEPQIFVVNLELLSIGYVQIAQLNTMGQRILPICMDMYGYVWIMVHPDWIFFHGLLQCICPTIGCGVTQRSNRCWWM